MIRLLALKPLAGKALRRLLNAPGRDALAKGKAEYSAAQADVARIQARIDRLKAIIEAQGPAEAALASAVTADDAVELERFAQGDSAPMGEMIVNADAAIRAAQVARSSLPAAEREIEAAQRRVRELETAQRRRVGAVLVEHCDVIGEEYVATFRHLRRLHDQLVGLARGTAGVGGRDDIVLASVPLEAPRFGLPSMPTGDVYSHFLRHVPDARRINAMVSACSMAAKRLLDDPFADIVDLFSEEALAQSDEIKQRPGETPRFKFHQRERPAEPSVREAMFGGEEDRSRRVVNLNRAAG